MNKYFMFIFFICMGGTAYSMQKKEFKNTTRAPQSMTRQEIKTLCPGATETYNHIPAVTTNQDTAKWRGQQSLAHSWRIITQTKLTSPTNKVVPIVHPIHKMLCEVLSPESKKTAPKIPFPQNIYKLSKEFKDTATLAKPLYSPSSKEATILTKIEEAAQELEATATEISLNQQQKKEEENKTTNLNLKQQSLSAFIPGIQTPEKPSVSKKRSYKRKKDDIEDNKSIDEFIRKKAKTTESQNSQETPEIIVIEDDTTCPQETSSQRSVSSSDKLAHFRHNPVRKALFNN